MIIDDFLDEALARDLLAQFPAFQEKLAINELGNVGGKAVMTAVRSLGDAYARLDAAVSQRPLLDWIGEVADIPDLQYDEDYYGGGTHENRDGQELDPHVDFNYHPRTGLHRRLNVIVYLNEEWDASWGGSIAIHSNPREPYADEIREYAPAFNRCIIFETHESSWHGFRRIKLPPDRAHLSRKSISLYFYTATRPHESTAAPHGTFYVKRPLSEVARAGDVLDSERLGAIDALIRSRDQYIAFYQAEELRVSATVEQLKHALAEARAAVCVPVCGPVIQLRNARGFGADGWVERSASVGFRAVAGVRSVSVAGSAQIGAPALELTVRIGERTATTSLADGAPFELRLPVDAGTGDVVNVEFTASAAFSPAELGHGADVRALSWLAERIEFSQRAEGDRNGRAPAAR